MKSNPDVVLLFSGKQGSGKTTLMNKVFEEIMEGGNYRPVNVIFADTIYKIHDFAIKLLEERGIKRDIVKDGKLLQLLGTEWGRQINENIWVECLKGQMKTIRADTPESIPLAFIVSDCRFQNELAGFPEAFKVRLEASKEVRQVRCSQWRDTDNHPSEIDLDVSAKEGKFDLYLDTDSEGGLKTTFKQFENALESWAEAYVSENGNKFYPTQVNYKEVSARYYQD